MPGDRGVDLARRHRLDEIALERRADRLGHRRVFLALRDHDDEEVRIGLAKLAERVEAALAGHLLVEQHEVERPATNHLDGVVGVRRHFDVEPFVPQEDAVRLEELRLVVDPEDGLRRLRHAQNIVGRCAGSVERSRLRCDRFPASVRPSADPVSVSGARGARRACAAGRRARGRAGHVPGGAAGPRRAARPRPLRSRFAPNGRSARRVGWRRSRCRRRFARRSRGSSKRRPATRAASRRALRAVIAAATSRLDPAARMAGARPSSPEERSSDAKSPSRSDSAATAIALDQDACSCSRRPSRIMADDSEHRHLTAFRPAVARRRGERRIAAARHDRVRLSEPRQIARRRISPWRSDRARRRRRRAASRRSRWRSRSARRSLGRAGGLSHRRDGRRARAGAHHRDRGPHAVDDLRQGTLDEATRASAGAVALRLRDHLPIIERLLAGAGVDGVAARCSRSCPDLDLVVVDSLVALAHGHSCRRTKSWRRRCAQLKALALDRDVAILTTAPLPRARRSARSPPDARRFRRAGFGETASPTSSSDCSARTCTSRRATSRARRSC